MPKDEEQYKPISWKTPKRILLLILGLPIYAVAKLIILLVPFRVGHFWNCERIGHLSVNTELYLREKLKDIKTSKERHVFICGRPANEALLKIISRKVTVIRSAALLKIYHVVRSFIGESGFWVDQPSVYYISGKLDDDQPQLEFSKEEELQGEELTKSMGIPKGNTFVCFHVRDQAYLNHAFPKNQKQWSYHSYRDCTLENYLPAMEYLAGLGIYVLRMGHIVEKTLATDNPLIIDYANNHRTDFGDVYLSARCKFFVASEGGLSSVPWSFNVPVVYTNSIPCVGTIGWRKDDLTISKKLLSEKESRYLTYSEILELGADEWFHAEQYEKAGVKTIENTSQEILDVVKEMNGRLEDSWQGQPQDEQDLTRYRALIPKGHRIYGFTSRMGTQYMRDYQALLEQKQGHYADI